MLLYLRRAREKFALVISNPPYIPEEEKHSLPLEVVTEPEVCWNGGRKGMKFYPDIVYESIEKIIPSGYLILEIGEKQVGEVKKLMRKAGFRRIGVEKDERDRIRVIWGKKM